MDLQYALGRIRVPTLVIVGSDDMSTPASDGRYIADHIQNARYVELPAAHLSNVQAASSFTQALLLPQSPQEVDEPWTNGSGTKTGCRCGARCWDDVHVDRPLAKRNAFNEEFQALITRYAWGEIWTRQGCPCTRAAF